MKEIFLIVILAISLSMDAFSLSLTISPLINKEKNIFVLPIYVGIMHFIMPVIGLLIGSKLIMIIHVKPSLLAGLILLFLAIEIGINILKKSKEEIDLSNFDSFLFALSVSIDAFSIGIGLSGIINNIILSLIIFSLTSAFFTLLGLLLGKLVKKAIGTYSNILSFMLLFIIGIYFLFK